ncbi:peptidase E [Prochlorococcus marinus]|uniref:Peptidase E n=1 Tax=Prochlorococcus marinus XMU1408 TaxID=2213228 RepID=A0A318R5Y4_PROMR|nr:peptidase E [Prochlorococcus marinus]MBW3042027.1 peptidase E [Prochlorococcus marinus str. XMU1408]PYE03148.1 peptidase E [Prochlorococcus marinus XMU1408]
MSKHIIAIGGGGFGRKLSSSSIEKYILSISNIDCPRICFLPTATGDNDSYIVRFYSVFTHLKCIPTHIELFKRTIDISDHIMNQDVVFVGGGNTKSMLAVWSDWGMSEILKKAYNKGVIMSGVSAGAICWFTSGITDSWDKQLRILPCLDFIKGTCCPHYDEEPSRIPFVNKVITEKEVNSCISIEGGAALHFIDGNPYKNVSFEKNKNSYNMFLENNEIIKCPYPGLQL